MHLVLVLVAVVGLVQCPWSISVVGAPMCEGSLFSHQACLVAWAEALFLAGKSLAWLCHLLTTEFQASFNKLLCVISQNLLPWLSDDSPA